MKILLFYSLCLLVKFDVKMEFKEVFNYAYPKCLYYCELICLLIAISFYALALNAFMEFFTVNTTFSSLYVYESCSNLYEGCSNYVYIDCSNYVYKDYLHVFAYDFILIQVGQLRLQVY